MSMFLSTLSRWLLRASLSLSFLCSLPLSAVQNNPPALRQLLNRIGGKGAASRFQLVIDEHLSSKDKDVFVIGKHAGKPCIKGNSILAVSTGINWYLSHHAGIQLTWSRPKVQLSQQPLPLPTTEERHEASVPLRYYLNYCTFSYSMAFWSRERWLQEIDWMALHGVNMPLMLVGAEGVWHAVLQELGYTSTEINHFVAGAGFQAWWLMNNLEGWGGPNPDWWYERQTALARELLSRMRSLGMEPVLPGYSGMIPHDLGARKHWAVADPGLWCQFQRPAFLSPTDSHFSEMAALYYKHLRRLLGSSRFYSMDPFHEGGSTAGVDIPAAYRTIEAAMLRERKDAIWVLQAWNENPRPEALRALTSGHCIVLDLFAEAQPRWGDGFEGQDFIYCMLHNFGGRHGLHGRMSQTIDGFYRAQQERPSQLKGIGATPEGIETNEVFYDLLFELPWRKHCSRDAWLEGYVAARYQNPSHDRAALADAQAAWSILAQSVYDCPTDQQGTSEAIFCARPSLNVRSVSTWSTSNLYYNPAQTAEAARLLLRASRKLRGDLLQHDLADFLRQALTDKSISLLTEVKIAYEAGDGYRLAQSSARFLDLLTDLDRLLASRQEFRLGSQVANIDQLLREASPLVARNSRNGVALKTSVQQKAWMLNAKAWLETNLRRQVTTWGLRTNANEGGLHDYSNRVWSGLISDYYLPRWKQFFAVLANNKPQPDWYAMEEAWVENRKLNYTPKAVGNTSTLAAELYEKWLVP